MPLIAGAKPRYKVWTTASADKIVCARSVHPCFGVPQRIKNFWVLVTSPICPGVIVKDDLHLEFNNPLTRQGAKACLYCVLYSNFSPLEGDLAQYRFYTPEQIAESRIQLEADIAELLEEPKRFVECCSGGGRPVDETCRGCQ